VGGSKRGVYQGGRREEVKKRRLEGFSFVNRKKEKKGVEKIGQKSHRASGGALKGSALGKRKRRGRSPGKIKKALRSRDREHIRHKTSKLRGVKLYKIRVKEKKASSGMEGKRGRKQLPWKRRLREGIKGRESLGRDSLAGEGGRYTESFSKKRNAKSGRRRPYANLSSLDEGKSLQCAIMQNKDVMGRGEWKARSWQRCGQKRAGEKSEIKYTLLVVPKNGQKNNYKAPKNPARYGVDLNN